MARGSCAAPAWALPDAPRNTGWVAADMDSPRPAMQAQLDIPPDGATFSRRQVQGDFDVIAYVNFAYPSAVIELTAQWHSAGSRKCRSRKRWFTDFSDSVSPKRRIEVRRPLLASTPFL